MATRGGKANFDIEARDAHVRRGWLRFSLRCSETGRNTGTSQNTLSEISLEGCQTWLYTPPTYGMFAPSITRPFSDFASTGWVPTSGLRGHYLRHVSPLSLRSLDAFRIPFAMAESSSQLDLCRGTGWLQHEPGCPEALCLYVFVC